MSYMNICLRGVTSPTLARGIPCPTLILVDCDRGVRSPTLIYKLARTCLDYITLLSRGVRKPTLMIYSAFWVKK